MKFFPLFILLLLVGCGSAKQLGKAAIGNDVYKGSIEKAKAEMISGTLAEFPNHSEIAVALVKADKVEFYGLKRINDSIHVVQNSESVFEIGSITKVFTTHLLLNLTEEGKIKGIDEPIAPYLDFTINNQPSITFRQLANHSSGLPGNLSASIFNTDPANPYKKWDRQKFVDFLKKDVKLESKPGEKYQYSNVGMALLAYVVTKIESKEYEDLLQENIFRPLQMERTSTEREKFQKYLVQGYNWKGKPTANWDLAEIKGAGAILSSVHDLSKYIIWNFDALNNELSPMTKSTMNINEDLDISLGWHLVKNKTQHTFLWHNGGTGGYKSSMSVNQANKTGVIILTNIGANNNPKRGLIDSLCFDLTKSLED